MQEFEDIMLEQAITRLEGRRMVEVDVVEGGELVTWRKDELIDFLGWTENTFQNKSNVDKKKALLQRGVTVVSQEGRGDNFRMKVLFTENVWYNILLRRKYRRSDITDRYLQWMFNGSGFIQSGSTQVAGTVMEVCQMIGQELGYEGKTVYAKVNRLRATIKEFGYLYKGEEKWEKTHRVKLEGQEDYVQGSTAIMYDRTLRAEWKLHFQDIDTRLAFREDMTPNERSNTLSQRENEMIAFTKSVKRKHGLGYMKVQKISTISKEARIDRDAITLMWRLGATFTEIYDFLEQRPAFWAQQ